MAGMFAPLATGIIIDRTGAYPWAFAISVALAVVAVLAWGIVIREVAVVGWPDELAVIR